MRRISTLLAAGLCAGALVLQTPAQAAVDMSLTRLDCGTPQAPTAVNERFSDTYSYGDLKLQFVYSCYLIKHDDQYLLWDTGHAMTTPNVAPKVSIVDQIAQLGVKPDDVKAMGVSHTHPDHIGNVEMFPQAVLYVQKAEYNWPGADNKPRFKPEHPVTLLEGDKDVFGDGSVVILSTPGHTPGHQSLQVTLPKTGEIVLSGDAVHFKSNWENRGVPVNNFSKEQTLASMERLSGVLTKDKAQLWINHDKAQRDTLKMSPEFYE